MSRLTGLLLVFFLNPPFYAKAIAALPFRDSIVIREIYLPSQIRPGQHVGARVTIKNEGLAEFSGSLVLDIRDSSGKPVDGWFRNIFPVQYFTAAPGVPEIVTFPFDIPYDYSGRAMLFAEAFDLQGNSLSKKENSFHIKGRQKRRQRINN